MESKPSLPLLLRPGEASALLGTDDRAFRNMGTYLHHVKLPRGTRRYLPLHMAGYVNYLERINRSPTQRSAYDYSQSAHVFLQAFTEYSGYMQQLTDRATYSPRDFGQALLLTDIMETFNVGRKTADEWRNSESGTEAALRVGMFIGRNLATLPSAILISTLHRPPANYHVR